MLDLGRWMGKRGWADRGKRALGDKVVYCAVGLVEGGRVRSAQTYPGFGGHCRGFNCCLGGCGFGDD